MKVVKDSTNKRNQVYRKNPPVDHIWSCVKREWCSLKCEKDKERIFKYKQRDDCMNRGRVSVLQIIKFMIGCQYRLLIYLLSLIIFLKYNFFQIRNITSNVF